MGGQLPADTAFPVNKGYANANFVGVSKKDFPWAWSGNDLHKAGGNVSFADGSVQQTSLSDLMPYLFDTTNSVAGGKLIVNFP
jgi:prepilin-type processing-associated H-X9-DG protein